MQRVVMDMRLALKDLDGSVHALEAQYSSGGPAGGLSQALRGLITQATEATRFLREKGPQLMDGLTEQVTKPFFWVIF